MRTAFLILTAGLASCTATGVRPHGEPVTPQRPTLSSDTNTAAEGTIEVEGGVYLDPDDTWSTPTTVRYGFSDRTEVFVGWVPLLHDDDRDVLVVGDSQLGIRHRYQDGDGDVPSAAVQATVNLPTGNEALGSGETDLSLAGILSGTHEDVSWTGYGSFDLRGDPSGPGVDPGFSLAVAGGFPVDGDWSPFAELAAVLVPERDVDVVFTTLGAFYEVAPELVFDVAVAIGLSDEAPDFALLFGFTRNLGSPDRLARGQLH